MKCWKVVVDGKTRGVFRVRSDASRASKAMTQKDSWSKVELVECGEGEGENIVLRRTVKKVAKKAPNLRPPFPVRFKEATGKLVVPAGTRVVVFRNVTLVNREGTKLTKKDKGWVKSKLKNERTFFECHQVTSMNKGMLETDTIKRLTSLRWMVFHTEDPNYPLIAFSAFTTHFPMKVANLGMSFENADKNALPFHSPLKYPPQGSTFERLFNEQKNAFLFKEGFDAGATLRKKKAEKQLDSDES